MKAEYDFSNAKRGAVIPQKGKTRIKIYIDKARDRSIFLDNQLFFFCSSIPLTNFYRNVGFCFALPNLQS